MPFVLGSSGQKTDHSGWLCNSWGGGFVIEKTASMKYLYTLLAICLIALAGCKKDNAPAAIVTITEKSSFGVVALVENPNPTDHAFLCQPANPNSLPVYNCTNAVYLSNLPAALNVVGKKIRFTKFKDHGQPQLFSSVNNAHELEVYDAVEVP